MNKRGRTISTEERSRGRQPWRSIRWRVLAMAAAVTAFPLSLVMLSFLVDEGLEDRMRGRVNRAGADAALALSRDGRFDPAALDAIAEEYAVRIRLLGGESMPEADHDGSSLGALFFTDDGAPTLEEFDATLPPVLERAESRAARREPVAGCRTAPGGRLLVCHAARSVTVGPSPVLIYVQESSRRSVRALYDLRYQLVKLTLFVLPLSLLLAWWLGRRLVRPIEQLRSQVHQRLRSGERAPITLERGDELGDLATAFEHLVGQLDTRARSNEAFVADVMHELKSPVATVRACAELLEGGAPEPECAARLSVALGDSACRMEALLGRLLELARAESGMPDVEREEIAFGPLVAGVVADARLRHPDAQITFEGELDGHVIDGHVIGVPEALADAVRNLVDNAAAFATVVNVSVSVDDSSGWARLIVADDGPGIEPDDLPRVFDRFFTTRPRAEGTGLGLALVRAVVDAHGGEVDVSSSPGEGARFSVRLPGRSVPSPG